MPTHEKAATHLTDRFDVPVRWDAELQRFVIHTGQDDGPIIGCTVAEATTWLEELGRLTRRLMAAASRTS